jgi:hypothetical protein
MVAWPPPSASSNTADANAILTKLDRAFGNPVLLDGS